MTAPTTDEQEEAPTDAGSPVETSGAEFERFRFAWIQSEERTAWRKSLVWTIPVAVLFTAGCATVAALIHNATVTISNHATDVGGLIVTLAAAGAGLYLSAAAIVLHRISYRRSLRARMRYGVVTELKEQEQKLAESGTDFDSLWLITQKRIDYYHDIATQQARTSFRSGQVASGAGFFAVILIAIFAAFSSNGTGAIAASVIGTAGAGLSAYIASTFAKSQAAASAQLRAFFLQPVEFSRALSAERLINQVPPEDRAKIVERIVDSMTSAAGVPKIDST